MKKVLMLTAAMLLMTFFAEAQKKYSVYAVGFYNLENLFDTCHDEGKNDYEFLPTGSYRWDGIRYSHKLHNMARALSDMGTDVLPGVGCAVIGVSEVENAKALTDLVNQPATSSSPTLRDRTSVGWTAHCSTIPACSSMSATPCTSMYRNWRRTARSRQEDFLPWRAR